MNAPSLPELQQAFAAAVLDADAVPPSDWVNGNGLAPEARLRIYRHIVFGNLTDALATAYPAVRKLVGNDFFDAAAARYIRDCPSRTGNLQDYGAAFPVFLAQMPEAQEVGYLADVAQLEWARQQAYLAADATGLGRREALSAVAESEIGSLRFSLHPSLRLVVSAHPVWDIWMFCQQEAPEHLDLSGTGQAVAVWREDSQIAMQPLDPGVHQWLGALLAGKTLAAACDRATAVQADFNLVAAMQWLLDAGLVTQFSVAGAT